jgi:hypothetical protein
MLVEYEVGQGSQELARRYATRTMNLNASLFQSQVVRAATALTGGRSEPSHHQVTVSSYVVQKSRTHR